MRYTKPQLQPVGVSGRLIQQGATTKGDLVCKDGGQASSSTNGAYEVDE